MLLLPCILYLMLKRAARNKIRSRNLVGRFKALVGTRTRGKLKLESIIEVSVKRAISLHSLVDAEKMLPQTSPNVAMLGSCRVLDAMLGGDSATSCQDGAKTARTQHNTSAR